jgi:trans-2,3-dihydro-3-hydroxyanthranilate isomerase
VELDLEHARGREVVLARAERSSDLRAVRLVTDRDHGAAGAFDRGEQVVRARPGREPLVHPELGSRAGGDRSGSLSRAQQRARQHKLRLDLGEALAQLPRLLVAARAEGSQRVRVARIRVSVTDEEEAHADRFTDMRSFRYVLADVFTDRPLAGNQLAVFTDARDLDEVTMQGLALELGLSETVFVLPPRDGGTVRIRIFTPWNELPFAGHPCLGTAFVLGAPLQLSVIALETGQGIVPVELERDESGRIVFGRMTQPIPAVAAYGRAEELLLALGVESSDLPVEVYDNGVRHAYVMLPAKEDVARLRPDMNALMELDLIGALACAGSGASWKVRMFSPLDGVGEDAATGSAAGPLACHLGRHGLVPWGEQIEIEQGTEIGRPSTLYARATGSGDRIDSVEVGGSAVTVARGEFKVP